MSSFLLIIIIAIAAIALFMLGLSLTLIFKGHNLQSEIGENDEMKKRGIKCTSQQIIEDEAALRGVPLDDISICAGSCSSCADSCTEEKEE